MVPLSHSLEIVKEVNKAEITIMITPINPGIMLFLDCLSGLYQMRVLTPVGFLGGSNPLVSMILVCMFSEKLRTTVSAYPNEIMAVFESLPSTNSCACADFSA